MIIGKIDYINLLPFYVFLKKRLNSQEKAALNFYKGVPSQINKKFQKGRVEAAVISSIISAKYSCSDFGIVAHKKVASVLVCPGTHKKDEESDTSNILAKVLGLQGEILIGDKALRHKHKGCVDLARKWYEKYRLPFVFARFCYRKRPKAYQKLAKEFLEYRGKIPDYILKQYARRSGLSSKEIQAYLKLIGYTISIKEKRSLKKFLKIAKKATSTPKEL
ncbi:MAG: hypothetical protein C6H99_06285 [Epsilonproteobacteria bacterium]|nr:hypothetical protein [Campylobacterota bacterium]NPA63772.1 hypothetical protein [Campylobacterota bacterium]